MNKWQKRVILFSIIFLISAIFGGILIAKYIVQAHNNAASHIPAQPTPQKTALSCVESLPESMQIGQKIMAAGYSDQFTSLRDSFIHYGVGGVILMDEAPAQNLSAFKQGFLISPTLAVDQEGGTVQRYKSEGIVPGATDMALNYTSAQAYQKYYTDAQYLKTLGITVNFGPVLGVMSAVSNPLPGRMYASDPTLVVKYAIQFIKASLQAGVTPVVKHFPGLGSTTTNTDDGSATTDPLATLQARDIIPYQKLAQYNPDAMVSNAIVPGLTDGQPAIWSAAAVNLLRSEGYKDAVIYTDSLTAKAIPGTIPAAAVASWQAGDDVVLIVQKKEDTTILPAILEKIVNDATTALQNGQLDKTKFSESVVRILARKHINPCTITYPHT